MDKNDLRSFIKKKLASMTDDEFWQCSDDIHKTLFSLPEWKNAQTVAVTMSTGREVDTTRIIERAWQESKRIVVPKCHPKMKTMEFRSISSFDQLERVYFGLLEPKVEETEKARPDQIELMIVPGIVYDRRGYRIGYGGGYFDRYLPNYKNETLSLAFSLQIVERVPTEAHDMAVSALITEDEVIS